MPKLAAFRCADMSNRALRLADVRIPIWTTALLLTTALPPQYGIAQQTKEATQQNPRVRAGASSAVHPSASKLSRAGNLRLHLSKANRAVFLSHGKESDAADIQSCVFSISDDAAAEQKNKVSQNDKAELPDKAQSKSKTGPEVEPGLEGETKSTQLSTESEAAQSEAVKTDASDDDTASESSASSSSKEDAEVILMPSPRDRAGIPEPDFNALELVPSHVVRGEDLSTSLDELDVKEPVSAPIVMLETLDSDPTLTATSSEVDASEPNSDAFANETDAPRPEILVEPISPRPGVLVDNETSPSDRNMPERALDAPVVGEIVSPDQEQLAKTNPMVSPPTSTRDENALANKSEQIEQVEALDPTQDSKLEWVAPKKVPSELVAEKSTSVPVKMPEDSDYEPRRTASSGIPLKLVSERKTLTLSSSGDKSATSRKSRAGQMTLEVRDSSSALTLSNEASDAMKFADRELNSGELSFSNESDRMSESSGSQSTLQFAEPDFEDSNAESKDTLSFSKSSSRHDGESGDKECPGAPKGADSEATADHRPEDVPLEQQPHPYDAPKAQSEQEPDPRIETVHDYTTRELVIHRKINETLDYFMKHPENVARRGPWALMHASLPFGVETEVIAGNRRVNALGWMCHNGVCYRQRMFQPTRTGFRTNVGPGVQGHEGQFLAILAQSRVQSSYPIKVGNRSYTIQDLVRYEMATCREKSELTFKLIGLSYYLQPNQRWRDNRGRVWNLEKMVAEELAQPINGVACGGSHRLMGLSYAIIERQREGEALTGHWARAEKYLNDYVNYTMTLQNQDGSFSTNWFEGRGNKQDTERKVQTTGHMLEWLIYTLPDDYLRSPRIQVSIEYLLNTVGANPGYDWPIGPRGHALRAMALYNQRVFGAEQGNLGAYIAAQRAGGVIR